MLQGPPSHRGPPPALHLKSWTSDDFCIVSPLNFADDCTPARSHVLRLAFYRRRLGPFELIKVTVQVSEYSHMKVHIILYVFLCMQQLPVRGQGTKNNARTRKGKAVPIAGKKK